MATANSSQTPAAPTADSMALQWKRVKWNDLQHKLEEEVNAIAKRQEEADVGKKRLVDQSELFRLNTDKEIRKASVPLIKSFQSELDSLTTRSKAAESVVLELCRRISHIPDPLPILDQAGNWQAKAQKTHGAELEVKNLKERIAALQQEFAELKNQDVTIRQLREKIKSMETEADSNIQTQLEQGELTLREQFAESERALTQQLETANAANEELRRRLAQRESALGAGERQIAELRARLDRQTAIGSEQLDILATDLEHARQRAESAEHELLRLRAQLQKEGGESPAVDDGDNLALEQAHTELRAKENKIRALIDENKKLTSRLADDASESRVRIAELTAELERHAEIVDRLETRIAQQADYEEIKKELRVLKSLEFGNSGENGHDEVNVSSSGSATKGLELLLMEKNKALQGENASLRLGNATMQDDEILQRIMQPVMEAIQRMVGEEIAQIYADPSIDWDKEKDANQSDDGENRSDDGGNQTTSNSNLNPTELLALLMRKTTAAAVSHSHTPSPGENNDLMADLEETLAKNTVTGVGTGGNNGGHEQSVPKWTPNELKNIAELQALVAENVRKLGARSLNTMEIATQCKRLMSAYNLGQRLFAKVVMNQSQGSLSELLSKPRHWARLTEKGREAFRRIFAWISDDRAIDRLCALSPRRVVPAVEVKIDHPDPKSLLDDGTYKPDLPISSSGGDSLSTLDDGHSRRVSTRLEDTKISPRSFASAASPGSGKTNSRWRHDDIPKEKIINIFQTELAKLREQESNLERVIHTRPASTVSATSDYSSARDSDAKLTNASTMLNSSLQKLEQIAELTPLSSLSSLSNSAALSSSSTALSMFSAGAAPRLRTGLPPISQDQFEQFGNIDTDEVVRQIKDYLSMNSISQRQFGETVLGLSQGSVSDLLARPKPWQMLTQKGREPFIRMKLFLQDAGASHSLKHDLDTDIVPSMVPRKTSLTTLQQHPKSPTSSESDEASRSAAETPAKPAAATDRYVPLTVDSIAGNALQDLSSAASGEAKLAMKNEENEELTEKALDIEQYLSNTSDQLDTADIVRQVKELLHYHGIAQKTFGDIVLGVSPGGTSELLSRPKPWTALSARGKEPYLKMNDWLQDPDNVARFSSNTATTAPIAATITVGGMGVSNGIHSNSRKRSAGVGDDGNNGRKAPRTVITDKQKEALKFVFAHDQHPSQKTIELLATKLDLSNRTVNNWFHNFRTRQKAKETAERESASNNGGCGRGRAPIRSQEQIDGQEEWHKGLFDLLDKVGRSSSSPSTSSSSCSAPPPSMVKLLSSLNSSSSSCKPSSPVTNGGGVNCDRSQLDKAIARMHRLAAAKNA